MSICAVFQSLFRSVDGQLVLLEALLPCIVGLLRLAGLRGWAPLWWARVTSGCVRVDGAGIVSAAARSHSRAGCDLRLDLRSRRVLACGTDLGTLTGALDREGNVHGAPVRELAHAARKSRFRPHDRAPSKAVIIPLRFLGDLFGRVSVFVEGDAGNDDCVLDLDPPDLLSMKQERLVLNKTKVGRQVFLALIVLLGGEVDAPLETRVRKDLLHCGLAFVATPLDGRFALGIRSGSAAFGLVARDAVLGIDGESSIGNAPLE